MTSRDPSVGRVAAVVDRWMFGWGGEDDQTA
jgi:hypothetical protein